MTHRIVFVLSLLLVLAGPARGQTSMENGARTAALGGAATALPDVPWGYANPASRSTLSERVVAFFATQAFGLSELRLGAAQVVEPTGLGTFALGARTFGFEDYRETHLNLGYARGVQLGTSRRFHLGVNVRYHRVSVPDYGAAGTVELGLGGLVSVLPVLDLGFHWTNPHVPTLGGEELPRTLAVGLHYAPMDLFRVVVDAYKDVRFPLAIRSGIEVRPVDVLFLRVGAATEPSRWTAGVGVAVGAFVADVAAERHEVLGWSPAVAFSVRW
ncbi:MAG: hypothetical protein GVY18_02365 [Bacteroidetes bacterium]|jgi:hypothetical protein|nr:hypothetical protein [Bacteroidota bacterium]